MNDQFYDIVDSDGKIVITTEEQAKEAAPEIIETAVISEAEKKLVTDNAFKSPEITPGELKKVNKVYVTIQHPKVVACKHSLDLSRQPRHRNCEHCWFAWFNTHGEIVQQLDEMHTNGQDAVIITLQGNKFYHRWRQFMATVAQWKVTQETDQEKTEAAVILGEE